MEIKTLIDVKLLKEIRREKPDWSDSGAEIPVYRIKISELHYNEENGRIATWISTYYSEKDNKPLLSLNRDEFNNIIESFILNSNSSDSFKSLITDIEKKTQLTPGVILDDGTVVSGNRRFTALRRLYKEEYSEKYEYFECFVLPTPQTKDQKAEIKLIETKTQFGNIREEDYNPIDRLVTIYRYLISEETKIWSIKEYAKKIGIKESEADNLYNRALIMVDYLEHIGRPQAFHEVRIKKLDGPINELANLYKKLKTQKDEWERIKPLFYSEMSKSGDRTRKVRELKKLYDNESGKIRFNLLLEELYKKQELLEEKERNSETYHSEFVEDAEGNRRALTSVDDETINKSLMETRKENARTRQISKITSSLITLREIEIDELAHMSIEEIEKIRQILSLIENRIAAIKKELEK